jgi:hypothetical protein
MTAVAEVQPGTYINAKGIGGLTVVKVFYDETEDLYEVDVEPDRGCDIWDMDVLARSVGAQWAMWLSNTPRWLYRLSVAPDARVG